MKGVRRGILLTLLGLSLGLAFPAWAQVDGQFGPSAGEFAYDKAGFRLEVQPGTFDKPVTVKLGSTDYSRIEPVEKYFVTTCVDISAVNNSGQSYGVLSKTFRLVFSFTEIDFQRAARMDTGQPPGRFRIARWNEEKKEWLELPSTVFWNGSLGAVECETDRGAGRYALVWSYEYGARLSQEGGDQIRIMFNSVPFSAGIDPYINNGRMMVPLSAIAQKLGLKVAWDQAESRIDLLRDLDRIQLWIGRTGAKKNGQSLTLEVAPEITEDRTFVPLRFMAENLGARVIWDDVSRTVRVLGN